MAASIRQKLSLKLQQKLSPQQIQLMKLIQQPMLELEQSVKKELEENPALDEGKEEEFDDSSYEDQYDKDNEEYSEDKGPEEVMQNESIDLEEFMPQDDIPEYKLRNQQKRHDEEEKAIPFSAQISFYEALHTQLELISLDERRFQIAEYIIGSINDNGYLEVPVEELCDDLAFTKNIACEPDEMVKIVHIIQQFEPPGVGARNLKESLILQLSRKEESPSRQLALRILESYFESFAKKHYDKLIQKLKCTEDELKLAIAQIAKLNPKPGNTLVSNGMKGKQQIVPDFEIRIDNDELDLRLNNRNIPDLKINKDYIGMIEQFNQAKNQTKQIKDAALFAKRKLDSAKWFIEAIRQRYNTLSLTMHAIMEFQKEYFLSGDERNLKPMILKDIANIIEMDISTVSRVANSKYVQTPFGTKRLKEFFSEALTNSEGEEVSTLEIKKILEDVLALEDKRKPLTDEKLAAILKEKGYPIARRTVAKYREQLHIPVARMRKKL